MSLKFDSSGNMASKKNAKKASNSGDDGSSAHEVSTDEEYYYTDDDMCEADMCEADSQDNDVGESKMWGDEDIPEYRRITEENMYEFMIWANDFKEKNIPVDYFNMVLQSNIQHWVDKNNITWQYALTLTSDIVNTQKNIDEQFDISNCPANSVVRDDVGDEVVDDVEDDVVYKPTSLEDRRKLFAAAAEKRVGRRFGRSKQSKF